MKANDENSRIRIRIHFSEAHGSGSGSVPKCHRSATLVKSLTKKGWGDLGPGLNVSDPGSCILNLIFWLNWTVEESFPSIATPNTAKHIQEMYDHCMEGYVCPDTKFCNLVNMKHVLTGHNWSLKFPLKLEHSEKEFLQNYTDFLQKGHIRIRSNYSATRFALAKKIQDPQRIHNKAENVKAVPVSLRNLTMRWNEKEDQTR